jgi:hypothetical protein
MEALPALWTTRVRARPFAMVAGSVNASLAFTITDAAGRQAEWFWQEENNVVAFSNRLV